MSIISPQVARYGATASILVGIALLFTYVMVLNGSEGSLPREESSAQDAGAGLIQEPASVDESVDKFGLSFESFMRGVKTQEEKMGLVEVWGNRDTISRREGAGKAASLAKMHRKATMAYHKSKRAYDGDISQKPHKALKDAKKMLASAQKEELLRQAQLQMTQEKQNMFKKVGKEDAVVEAAKHEVAKVVKKKVKKEAKKAAKAHQVYLSNSTHDHRTEDNLPGIPGMHSTYSSAPHGHAKEKVTQPLAKDAVQATHELVHGKNQRDKAEMEIRDAIMKLRKYGSSSGYTSTHSSLDAYLSSLGYHHDEPYHSSYGSSYASSDASAISPVMPPPLPINATNDTNKTDDTEPPPLLPDGLHCSAAEAMCELFGWKARNVCTSTHEPPEVSFRSAGCQAALDKAAQECREGLEHCGHRDPSKEASQVLDGVIHKPLPHTGTAEVPPVPEAEDDVRFDPDASIRGLHALEPASVTGEDGLPHLDDSREIVYRPPPPPPPPSMADEIQHWHQAVHHMVEKDAASESAAHKKAAKQERKHGKAEKKATVAEAEATNKSERKAHIKAPKPHMKHEKAKAKAERKAETTHTKAKAKAVRKAKVKVDRKAERKAHRKTPQSTKGKRRKIAKKAAIPRYRTQVKKGEKAKSEPVHKKVSRLVQHMRENLHNTAERTMTKAEMMQAILKKQQRVEHAKRVATRAKAQHKAREYHKLSHEYKQQAKVAAANGKADVEKAFADVFSQQEHSQHTEHRNGHLQTAKESKEDPEEEEMVQILSMPDNIVTKLKDNNEKVAMQKEREARARAELQKEVEQDKEEKTEREMDRMMGREAQTEATSTAEAQVPNAALVQQPMEDMMGLQQAFASQKSEEMLELALGVKREDSEHADTEGAKVLAIFGADLDSGHVFDGAFN